MAGINTIFKIASDGTLEIDKEAIKLEPSFKKIVQRDKGSEGDADGRKKYFAMKEFGVIYYIGDPSSPPNIQGMKFNEALDEAKKAFDLHKDYKPDKIVLDAIDRYTELCETASTKLLKACNRSLRVSTKVLISLSDRLEEQYDLLALSDPNDPNFEQQIKLCMSNIEKILKMNGEVSPLIEKVQKLEKKVYAEQQSKIIAMGGREVGNRADPNRGLTIMNSFKEDLEKTYEEEETFIDD